MNKIAKSILISDFGSYTTMLPALVHAFQKVGYFCNNDSSYPRSANTVVGKGIEGVTHELKFWDVVDDYDIIAFFDCHSEDIQEYLRKKGKQVWGAGKGVELELDRFYGNNILKEVGLPSVDMKKVIGIDSLRKFLKENDDIYVKNNSRGDFESFHSENYKLIEPQLDLLEKELGMFKNEYEFICCFPLDSPDTVEVGSDSYFIDGKYPQNLLYGYEVKDCGGIFRVKRRELISKIITTPLDKLSLVMEEYKYRGFFSTEIRVNKDKKPYLTDYTCRASSPCSELYSEMIENLGEVIDMGSQGIFVEPVYKAKYGVEAIIHAPFAETNWQPIYFPDEIKDCVKIKHWTVIDGVNYYVPIDDLNMVEVGAVVAYDNTLEGAIKKLNDYASKVEGFKLHINTESMDKANEIIKKGERLGINL